MRNSLLPWVMKERTIKVINLHKLFSDYWTSKEHELRVLGQSPSPTSSLIPDREAQRLLSSESTLAL